MSGDKQNREVLILRVLWMALFAIVWQVAELVLLVLVLVQLVLRLINGAPSRALMDFGDSLSQYLAQIGRFGCFHSDEKPWPFADWPTPREPLGEGAQPLAAPAAPGPVVAAADAVQSPVADAAASAEQAPPPAKSGSPAEPASGADGERKTEPDAPAEPRA